MHSRPHELDDEQLAELAREWRERAGRGEQLAFGVAQAFEAEQRRRRRIQGSQVQLLASPNQLKMAPSRPWWKFW
jgi:hypothetical protein